MSQSLRVSPRVPLVVASMAATALAWAGPAGERLPLVAVHDAGKGSESGAVSFIHPETHAVLGTVTVKGDPWPLGYDVPRSSFLLLGATPRNRWSDKPAGPWSLLFADPATLAGGTLGEVGLPPVSTLVDFQNARAYTLGHGPKDGPAVLGVFDLAERKMLKRVSTAPGPIDFVSAAGVKRIYVLHGGEPSGRKELPSRLIALDTETLEVVSDIRLPSRAAAMQTADEDRLIYVLCRGGKRKRGPSAQGQVIVIDAAAGKELARIDAGFEARSLRVDRASGRVYALGERPEDSALQLAVVAGRELAGRLVLPVASGGLRAGPDAGRLFVIGDKSVVEVDTTGPAVARTWELEFEPTNFLLDAARHRAFVTPHLGLRVAEIGLDDGRVHMSLSTGRKGTKAGKAIGLALLGVVERSGTALQLGPEGRLLYVVNGQTDDVTIIDTEKHSIVDYVPTGGGTRRVFASADFSSIYVESNDFLSRIDTASNEITQRIPLGAAGEGRGAITIDHASGQFFIPRGKTIDAVDIATGRTRGSITLPRPVSVVSVSKGTGGDGTQGTPAAGAEGVTETDAGAEGAEETERTERTESPPAGGEI